MNRPPLARPRIRLWMKLALLAALGVVTMHAIHLTLGNRIAARALARQQEQNGRSIARLVAEQAVEPLLVDDMMSLDSIVRTAVGDGRDVAYCLVLRDGQVVARAQPTSLPASLDRARPPGERLAVVVRSGFRRYLDVSEPVLGGVGEVRVGLDMRIVGDTRAALGIHLGLLALAVIAAGLLAAFALGRNLARPLEDILRAADRFDPSDPGQTPVVSPRSTDEIGVLGERFNQMLLRLKAAYQEQARAREKAVETERLVALGTLVAGVAHEVNNPLAGLLNCVHRLERAELPAERRAEYLHLMREGLDRIEHVVKRLLDFGRPRPTQLAPISLGALAQEAAAFVAPLLRRQRVACRIADEGLRERTVLADRHQVGQALVNLLLNAAYVSRAGGEIRLRLAERPGLGGLAVEDDGPGIPAEFRERIRDPFFSTKPPGEGTGLGLSVTQAIVAAHGGELTFDFPERGGTVAALWFRAFEAPSEAKPAA